MRKFGLARSGHLVYRTYAQYRRVRKAVHEKPVRGCCHGVRNAAEGRQATGTARPPHQRP
jgi:hypothetical protein